MPLKLFALNGEATSFCFSVSYAPEGMFDCVVPGNTHTHPKEG